MPVAVAETERFEGVIGAKEEDVPYDDRVEAASRGLRQAKVSFSDGCRGGGEQPLHGAPGRPDPFSAAWRGGLMRSDGADADDGDVVLVDDFAGVDDAEAYIPLERGEDDVVMRAADAPEGEDGEGSGEEWELEQLRRAGHAVEKDGEKVPEQLARRVVRAADEEGRRAGAVAACLRAAAEARGEWGARGELAAGRLRRLLAAERGGEAAAREVEREIEAKKRRLKFYESLSAHVNDVMDMLEEKRNEIVSARQAFFAKLKAEAEEVRNTLKGGRDEFGRSRQPSLQLPEAEEADEGEDVFADVADEVRSIATLVGLFRRWRREYAEEYSGAFGDEGLGKLAARLAQPLWDAELGWSDGLEGAGREEAVGVGRGAETVAAGVRARWRPREEGSCERWAKVAGKCGSEGREVVREAFCERARVEMEGCVGVGDAGEAGRCLQGVGIVERELRWDVGGEGLRKMGEEGAEELES